MAHFAGTGPAGKVCSDCQHWHNGGERKKQAMMQRASPESAVCAKFVEFSLKTIRKPPKPPHDAKACKYFEQYVDGGSNPGPAD